jgi:hypothetical protein
MSSDTEEKYGPAMATLGMFIVDTFEFYDAAGARTGPAIPPQESYSLACTSAKSNELLHSFR